MFMSVLASADCYWRFINLGVGFVRGRHANGSWGEDDDRYVLYCGEGRCCILCYTCVGIVLTLTASITG